MNEKINFCGVTLKNPVVAASGTFGFGEDFAKIYDISVLGGICSKGLTYHPRQGNAGVRVWETPSGMLNSVGLQNPGAEHFIEHELPQMRRYNTAVIANLGGGDEEEYLLGAKALDGADVDIIELNISCPNVKHGGMAFGIRSADAAAIVKSVRAVVKNRPLMVKLSPNAETITDMALSCQNAGADALSLVNTFKAMAFDPVTRKPVFENVTAGLSGPAIRPIALRMVYEVCQTVKIPVMGMGGIATARDAEDFLSAGAAAIQIGTANFINPKICLEIINTLKKPHGMSGYN